MFKWLMEKYRKWIQGLIVFCIVFPVIIYFLLLPNTPLSAGSGLTKSDWLSFLGGYLSFVGTVAVAVVSLAQSEYHSEMETRRRAEERHRAIQPVFAVKIISIDKEVPGITDSSGKHKNVVLEIKIANNNPAKNVLIFDKCDLGSLLMPGDKETVCFAYYDSPDANCENVFSLLDNDYERDDEGIPKGFNINYEDIDGRDVIQTFDLRRNARGKYYRLHEEPWEA